MIDKNTADRFWSKVDIRELEPGSCWEWTAARNPQGYGQFLGSRAHRVAVWLDGRRIPPGKVVRHTCDNPPCVNPAHLIVGTYAENARDMVERGRCPNANKTHCPRGHPYSAENTHVLTRPDGSERGRACKACQRLRTGKGRWAFVNGKDY